MAQEHSKITMSFIDHNQETGTFSMASKEVNDTDNTLDALDTKFDAVKAAVAAVTIGAQSRESRTYSAGILAAVPPSDANSQRERKWLVIGHDATTLKSVSLEIPCAKVSGLGSGDLVTPSTPGSNEYLDLEQGVGLALKTALDAAWKTGDTYANAVVVDRIELVHRRS